MLFGENKTENVHENLTEKNLEKAVFNFSKNKILEKKLVPKDLNFCLASKQLFYANYFVYFEFLYRNI